MSERSRRLAEHYPFRTSLHTIRHLYRNGQWHRSVCGKAPWGTSRKDHRSAADALAGRWLDCGSCRMIAKSYATKEATMTDRYRPEPGDRVFYLGAPGRLGTMIAFAPMDLDRRAVVDWDEVRQGDRVAADAVTCTHWLTDLRVVERASVS